MPCKGAKHRQRLPATFSLSWPAFTLSGAGGACLGVVLSAVYCTSSDPRIVFLVRYTLKLLRCSLCRCTGKLGVAGLSSIFCGMELEVP